MIYAITGHDGEKAMKEIKLLPEKAYDANNQETRVSKNVSDFNHQLRIAKRDLVLSNQQNRRVLILDIDEDGSAERKVILNGDSFSGTNSSDIQSLYTLRTLDICYDTKPQVSYEKSVATVYSNLQTMLLHSISVDVSVSGSGELEYGNFKRRPIREISITNEGQSEQEASQVNHKDCPAHNMTNDIRNKETSHSGMSDGQFNPPSENETSVNSGNSTRRTKDNAVSFMPTASSIVEAKSPLQIRFYGQFSKALSVVSSKDSKITSLGVRDNDYASSRMGLRLDFALPEVKLGAHFETRIQNNDRSNKIDQDGDGGNEDFEPRQINISADFKGLGKITIGHADTPTQKIAEIALHRAKVATRSELRNGNGFYLWGDKDIRLGNFFGNLDGMGRKNILRYDTPQLQLGDTSEIETAVSTDLSKFADATIRSGIENDWVLLKYGVGLVYYFKDTDASLSGSYALEFKETPIFINGSAGISSLGNPGSQYFYQAAGLEDNGIIPYGTTTLAMDYGLYQNFQGRNTLGHRAGLTVNYQFDLSDLNNRIASWIPTYIKRPKLSIDIYLKGEVLLVQNSLGNTDQLTSGIFGTTFKW